jgi:eukaryotic-like serine/threonine-protein kinase
MSTASLWYYARDRQRVGPLDWTALRQLAHSGQLRPTDMVLLDGTRQWQQAATVPDLFPAPVAFPDTMMPSAAHLAVTLPEPPPTPAAPLATIVAVPPQKTTASGLPVIPNHEVLEELGRGGMGVVYRARHIPLNRDVALKMVLAGTQAGAEALARFKAEAEAVARLQHPNIVQVHETGTQDGLPWFSLEFCAGGNLDQRLAGQPLPVRQAAELAETLARAIHHAHQSHVVHRDLKPANILLVSGGGGNAQDQDGMVTTTHYSPLTTHQLKITDFGLAKLCDAEEGRTRSGVIMGTPAYMAPEQAAGRTREIGPPCDVYALGAILYEMLTGRPPFNGAGAMEVVARVLAEEPLSPRQIDRAIPRDMETICLKCLEKLPGRRYTSARELADDLRRFLNHEPIQARPVSRPERLWRWCRRKPALAGAGALGILATVVLLALMINLRSAARQRGREREESGRLVEMAEGMTAARQFRAARAPLLQAQTLLRQHDESDPLREQVETALAGVDTRVRCEDFLTDAREAEYHLLGALWAGLAGDGSERIHPTLSRRGADLGRGVELARKGLRSIGLLEATSSLAHLKQQGLDEGEVRPIQRWASELFLLLALASERTAEGLDPGKRKPSLDEALGHLNRAGELDSRSPEVFRTRARILRLLGRVQPAQADEERARKLSAATFLDHHLRAGRWHRASEWTRAVAAYQAALAQRPDEYWTLFRLAKCLENLRQLTAAEALFRSCIALRPEDPTAYNNRGCVLLSQRKWDLAVEVFEAALSKDPDYALAYSNLMLAHAERKQVSEAEKVYQRYLEHHRADPVERSRALVSLGLAYDRAGQPEKALARYDAAVTADPRNALAHRNRAVVLGDLGRRPEAEAAIRRAIDLGPDAGDYWFVLGNNHAAEGRRAEARKAYDEAIRRSPNHAAAWYNRGVLLRADDDLEGALRDQTRALALRPGQSEALFERALVLASLKQYEAALADAERLEAGQAPRGEVRRLHGKILGSMGRLEESEKELTAAIEEDRENPDGYRSRAVTRMKAEKWQEAIQDFTRYLELAPHSPDLASIFNDLSVAWLELGKRGQGEPALDRALKALNVAVERHPDPGLLSNRANFYLITGDLARAVIDLDEAIRLDQKSPRAWALRGHARIRQGRFSDAVADLTESLRLTPAYETMIYRALAFYLGGKQIEARTQLERVVKDRPDHVRGKFARGMLALMDRKYIEAITFLSRVQDEEVLRSWVLLLRAEAWLALGGNSVSGSLADAESRAALFPREGLASLQAARVFARAIQAVEPGKENEVRRRALELLEQAIRLQPELKGDLGSDPALASVREDARFKALQSR